MEEFFLISGPIEFCQRKVFPRLIHNTRRKDVLQFMHLGERETLGAVLSGASSLPSKATRQNMNFISPHDQTIITKSSYYIHLPIYKALIITEITKKEN